MVQTLKTAWRFLLGRGGLRIHQRLMRLVLFVILSSFAAIALFVFAGANVFRQNIARMNDEFARSNSAYTKKVIEKTSMATLAKLAVADAWRINRELDIMRHDVDVLAQSLTWIKTHPESYLPQTVRDPYEGKVPPMEPYIIYSPEIRQIGIENVANEVALTANIKGTLISMEKSQGESYAACYFGSRNGFLICSSVFPGDEFSPISDDSNYDYDPRIRPWYINAVKSGKTVFSAPYLTILTQEHTDVEVISCSTPYYDENGIAGVASVDLATDGIRRFVSEVSGGGGEIRFVVDAQGDVVFSSVEEGTLARSEGHRDIRKTGEPLFDAAAYVMTEGKPGILLVELGGVRYYLAFAPVPAVDWSLGILVPEENISPSLAESQDFYRVMMEKFRDGFRNTYNSMLQGAMLVAALLIVLFFFLSKNLSGRFVRPILALTDGVREIAKGNFDKKLDIRTGDEIEELAGAMNHMTDELKSYIENYAKSEAEKERISTELDLAATIQTGMIPHIFPAFPERDDLDIYATMEPAKEVGGDFYDFYFVDERHLAVTMADVSGKGIGAALFMVITKTILKNFISASRYNDLGEMIGRVNDHLRQDNTARMFVTVFVGVLDLATGRFTYVNAGHNPPLVYRKEEKEFRYIDVAQNHVLGARKGLAYKSQELTLSPKDCLFLYTDGVTEAMDEEGNLYGEERLKKVLDGAAGKETMQELLASVREDIAKHTGAAEQSDDITMLGLAYLGRVRE